MMIKTVLCVIAAMTISITILPGYVMAGYGYKPNLQVRTAILESCLVTKRPIALIKPDCDKQENEKITSAIVSTVGILAPKAIELGVNLISAAIQKAGESKTTNSLSTTTEYFYDVDLEKGLLRPSKTLKYGCFVIAQGDVGDGKKTYLANKKSVDKERDELIANSFGFVSAPNFYYEGWFEFSSDLQAFKIDSKFLEVSGRYKKSGWGNTTDLIIVPAFYMVGVENGFGIPKIIFKGLRKNTILQGKQLSGVSTEWVGVPALPTTLSAKLTELGSLLSDIKRAKTEKNRLAKMGKTKYNSIQDNNETIRFNNLSLDPTLIKFEDAVNKLEGENNAAKKTAIKRLAYYKALIKAKQVNGDLEVSWKKVTSAQDDLIKNAQKKISQLFLSGASSIAPFSIKTSMVQTSNASKFMAKIASIVTENKDTIISAAKHQWDPATRRADAKAISNAEEKELVDTEDATLKAMNADHAVELYELQLSLIDQVADPEVYQSKLNAIRAAKLEANHKRRKAGLPAKHIIDYH